MRATDAVGTIATAGFKVHAAGLQPGAPYLVTAQSPAGGIFASHTAMVRLTVRRIPPAPDCGNDQASVRLAEVSDAWSDGHHLLGFMIVIRNLGHIACSVAGPPRLRFLDAAGQLLALPATEGDHEDPYTVLAAVGTAPRWVSMASSHVGLLAADTCSGASVSPRYLQVLTARLHARLSFPWNRRICTSDVTVDAFASDD